MQNEILNQQIIRFLKECPRSKPELYLLIGKTDEVRQALADLIEAGKVCSAIDGYRYELASGGHVPGPEGGSAA